MNAIIRISGKKLNLPTIPTTHWKFTVRPGGWIVAESSEGARRRLMFHLKREKLSASIGGALWYGEWIQQSHADHPQSRERSQADSDLIAQFPGKVRKILVQQGAQVSAGDSLLLIEAMKMEFAVRSPVTGEVRQILVSEGQQLYPGDQLIDVISVPSTKSE